MADISELLRAAAGQIRELKQQNLLFKARQESLTLVERLLDAGRNYGLLTAGECEPFADHLERAATKLEQPQPPPPSGPPQPGIMPKFVCHKTVEAMPIIDVREERGEIFLCGPDGVKIATTHEWMRKHDMQPSGDPETLGYWVRYDTGYTSWSPTEAFEKGYTPKPIDAVPDEPAAQP